MERLGLPFKAIAPDTDETPVDGESFTALSLRLAEQKARSVSVNNALVIGSDQVAVLGNSQLNKPGTPEKAEAQLKRAQDRPLLFIRVLHS